MEVELTSTVGRHPAQTTVTIDSVDLAQVRIVGNKQVDGTQVQLQVEVVVGHVHAVLGLLGRETRRSLLATGESRVCGGEGSFPH